MVIYFVAASELKVDLLHALEDFLGMYPHSAAEIVLIESIANSIDGGATSLEIFLDDFARTYTLVDNGTGMGKTDFDDYHTVALSSKDKLKGIGFAGVGAKIYLASWDGASVITETCGVDGPLKSRMFRNGEKLMYEMESSVMIEKGTRYTVTLSDEHYWDLKANVDSFIRSWYNWAIINSGLMIKISGVQVMALKPTIIKEKSGIIKVQKHKFPFHIWLIQDDFPLEWSYIVYTVWGKRVRNDTPDYIWELKPEFKNRVICIVEAEGLSNFLISNKEDFQKNPFRNSVFTQVRIELYSWLKENGMIVEADQTSEGAEIVELDITRELNRILSLDEFSWMNPWTAGISTKTVIEDPDGEISVKETDGSQIIGGTKGGDGSGGGAVTEGPDPGNGIVVTPSGDNTGTERTRTRKGLGVIPMDFENDPREGWVDIENRAVIINTAHPLAKKIEKSNDRKLLRYNLARVIISSLISDADQRGTLTKTPMEIFGNITNLFTTLFTNKGSDLSF